MAMFFHENINLCMPMHIGNGDSMSGPRIGGRPPANIRPSPISPITRYFATVPFSSDRGIELSIFLSFSSFSELARKGAYRLANNGDFVTLLLHSSSRRDEKYHNISEISSEHPLVISSPVPDVMKVEDDLEEPLAGHKIGGKPFIFSKRPSLMQELADATKRGCRLFCQFDFMVPGDESWEGTWPFGESLFQVFVSIERDETKFLWTWQM